MLLTSWLKSLHRLSQTSRRQRLHSVRRTMSHPLGAAVERLEDRTLLSATFNVTAFHDAVDANPGDGVSDDGQGNSTLRSAIMEANALPVPVTIQLEAGTYTLSLPRVDAFSDASGDLYVTGDVTIVGTGPEVTIIDAAQIDRVFNVASGVTLNLVDLTVTGGERGVIFDAGAPASEGKGGGVFNRGHLTITNVAVTGNRVVDKSTGEGAALWNNVGGTLTVTDSTISDNAAGSPGGAGAAIGVLANYGTAAIIRTTLSANFGGVTLSNRQEGTLSLHSVTIFNNTPTDRSGRISITNHSGTLHVTNSIIVGGENNDGPLLDGEFASGGFNIIGNPGTSSGFADGVNGDQVGVASAIVLDPVLGDNGGPTSTHALTPNSPAIDAGGGSNLPDTDQRGLPRPVDGIGDSLALPDIGAYELQTPFPDHDPPELSISPVSVVEGDEGTTLFVFTVSLSGPAGVPVTVDFATADGTATVADGDYEPLSGTLTFAPGETAHTITVNVIANHVYEPDKSFFVNLSHPQGASMAVWQGVGTIVNDDVPLDFGNAPDPSYPTLRSSDGARHLVVPGFHLGAFSRSCPNHVGHADGPAHQSGRRLGDRRCRPHRARGTGALANNPHGGLASPSGSNYAIGPRSLEYSWHVRVSIFGSSRNFAIAHGKRRLIGNRRRLFRPRFHSSAVRIRRSRHQ
jgi:hypothetical protein